MSCQRCGFPLCNECWTHVQASQPWCISCATEVTTRKVRRWSWAVSFLALAVGTCVVAWRSRALADDHAYIVFGAIGAAAVFFYLVHRAWSDKETAEVTLRTVEEPAELAASPGADHPYRARFRNVAMRAVPRVSGAQATILMLASLALCAVAFPAALRIPRWLEIEVVVGAWWAVLATVLCFLLYKGLRIADDFRFTLRREGADPKKSDASTTRKPGKSWLDPSGCADPGGCSDVEGCGAIVVIGLALAVGVGATWLVAEFAVPVFFAASYLLLTRALARVANDRHDCTGNLGRALGWGVLWATVYVLPLAVAVWGIHAVWKK